MRIVILSEWFAETMGYIENCLPRALAALGHEAHVVTSNVQPYFDSPSYKEIYEPFIGPPIVECGTKSVDGVMIHRLPHAQSRGRLRIRGLIGKLRELRPQIVQTFKALGLTTYEAAIAQPLLGYKLFTGCHVCASVFPMATLDTPEIRRKRLKWMASVPIRGRVVSWFTAKCHPATVDCADIAERFFGVPREKMRISPLGVDTNSFHPARDEASRCARAELRKKLGFDDSAIVCIHTGRFTDAKNPMCLARAIGDLVARGEPFRGLFVGNGPQKNVEFIRSCAGCLVHPFVPFRELPVYFRASDIGVWPTQESMSMLDAAACGVPIIISDRVQAVERVEGNGITYREGDVESLKQALLSLRDAAQRKQLGDFGAAKIEREFSWLAVARSRLQDYEAALTTK